MRYKQKILIALGLLLISCMLLFIAFGDKGFYDLKRIQSEKKQWVEKNNNLKNEIFGSYREIDRLKNDMELIKKLAKQELGFVEKEEIIFKTQPSVPTSTNRN